MIKTILNCWITPSGEVVEVPEGQHNHVTPSGMGWCHAEKVCIKTTYIYGEACDVFLPSRVTIEQKRQLKELAILRYGSVENAVNSFIHPEWVDELLSA